MRRVPTAAAPYFTPTPCIPQSVDRILLYFFLETMADSNSRGVPSAGRARPLSVVLPKRFGETPGTPPSKLRTLLILSVSPWQKSFWTGLKRPLTLHRMYTNIYIGAIWIGGPAETCHPENRGEGARVTQTTQDAMELDDQQICEITLSNRSRILGRFGDPKAESEITVKLLSAKLTKSTTQGSKPLLSSFTVKRENGCAARNPREFREPGRFIVYD